MTTGRPAVRSKGLTLIELLMAIVILGIALALASPFFVYTFGSFFSTDLKARTQAAAMIAVHELEQHLDDALDITILGISASVVPPITSLPAGASIAFTELVGASTPPLPAEFDPASPSYAGKRRKYTHEGTDLKLYEPIDTATPLVVGRHIEEITFSFDAGDPGQVTSEYGPFGRKNNYVNVKVHAHIGPAGTGARSGDVIVTDRIQTHSRRAGQ